MKINFPKDFKRWYTLNDIEEAKNMEKVLFEGYDAGRKYDFKSEIESAVYLVTGVSAEVLQVTAEHAKNARLVDNKTYFGEEAGISDVWFSIKALDRYIGFYEIGAYLTDIWQIAYGPNYDNREEIKSRFCVREYKAV